MIKDPICNKCGKPVSSDDVCYECNNLSGVLTAIRSYAIYEGSIREALHKLKFEGDLGLAEILSRPMIQLMNKLDWSIDLIVPVPCGLARRKERGYNQASLLALPIALRYGIPFSSKAIQKIRETRTQVGLSARERRENVKDTFSARRERVYGKSILVIDDITTTGATLVSCAETLLEQGASQVYGLTLARAVIEHP